jgi:hypothetical protein
VNLAGAIRAFVDNAGVFATPLIALALGVFWIATWAGLRVRDLDAGAPGAKRTVRDVTRALRLLAAAAAAAPLVGLLGTVEGLATVFGAVSKAGVFDRDALTRGVGRALFTTELGLAIAVPGIVLHAVVGRSLRARAGATVTTRVGWSRRRPR